MAAPSVGGSAVPGSLASGGQYGGGRYQLVRQPIRQSASGMPFAAGMQQAVWTWPAMGTTEYAWWWDRYDVLAEQAFELWEDDTRRTEIDFTAGWLQRPEHNGVVAGMYADVRITITHLMPLQG